MGDIIPFRRKRRWTRPEDYGHRPSGGGSGGPPGRRPRGSRLLVGLRPWALLVALIALWVFYDPMLYEPPAFLAGKPEHIVGQFTRCGRGRGTFCVVDGDTFKLGERKIRLIGVDAPETHPARCPAEARMGEAATAELQRLLNEGPFTIIGRIDRPVDRHGRELRAVTRARPDGSTQSIAEALRARELVRRYRGGMRKSWC